LLSERLVDERFCELQWMLFKTSVDPVDPVPVGCTGSQDDAAKMGRVEICGVEQKAAPKGGVSVRRPA
jgi:hypothetical protein